MAENFVQLPANSTGVKMRTFEQTVGANVVDHQAVVICDSSSNIIGSLASAPAGTEQGLIVRNIPSGTQAVSGTFWQATQPVSGTFWQTTQPVSLATAPSTPVTGTFWQATQPVSLASNTPDVTDRAARLLGAVTTSDVVAGPTAITTQNLNPTSGTATAASTVSVTGLNGVASIGIQITGVYTGALTAQVTTDNTNWVTLPTPLLSTPFGLYVSAVIPSATTGYLNGSTSGITAFRISANAAVTGTATVTVRASPGAGETQSVQGYTAVGQTTVGNPVRIGGADGGNVLRDFSLDTSGHIQPATPINQSVDGTGAAQPMQFVYFNVTTAQTLASLVTAPAAGRSIRVISYAIVVGAAMTVSLVGTGTTLAFALAANGGVSFAGTLQGPAFQCTAATALIYSTSAAGQATGHICYVVV